MRGYPFLTPPGDALALAAMLLAVIGDPARTAAQARLQQGRFAAGFTVQRMADDTAKAYLRALTLRDERAGKAAMKTGESVGFVGTDGMAARHL